MKYSVHYSVDYIIPVTADSAAEAEKVARAEIDIPGIALTVTPLLPMIGDVISGIEAWELPVGSVVVNDEDRQAGFIEPLVKAADGSWTFFSDDGLGYGAGEPEPGWDYYVALIGATNDPR